MCVHEIIGIYLNLKSVLCLTKIHIKLRVLYFIWQTYSLLWARSIPWSEEVSFEKIMGGLKSAYIKIENIRKS